MALDPGTVAVVGVSCRLPGASDPAEFWRLLREGRDAIGDTPPSRLAGLDEVPAGLRRGGFLDGVDRFDAAFFGIAPREATAMDPQQRLALELAWEALEDAGIVPGALGETRAGVYVGAIAADYAELALAAGAEGVARRAFTGTQRSMIANRVSYALGLGGPSLTVDTGQSSSLVAVHLACESLRSGESTIALAGGVQLNLALGRALALDRLGALSPDGRCFTLDARANGFVRGEGGAFLVLKPLAAAVADGDPVYCVIRGSAVNNDGGGEGLTVPEQGAQERMLRAAHEAAGIAAEQVGYVELHGTGTPVGDRVEASALGAVFGGRPLAVGSAKTNVGHLEAAAGVTGLLKVALAMDRGELPASLNFERPNPELDLDALGLRVQTETAAWTGDSRVAGVSSFGLGGTNCHVVVEAPPAREPAAAPTADPAPWIVSAKSVGAVRQIAGQLADVDAAAADVARSLATTRTAFPRRAVLLDGARDAARALAEGRPDGRVIEGVADPELRADRPVFVFPGQGGQWEGMALELLDSEPVFAEKMRACEEALARHAGFSLQAALRGGEGAPSLERTEIVQPVLWAIMVSLAELWRSRGVEPAAVVGHSQGEIAAAHVAGALSLDDAARVVAVRSRALTGIAGQGGMMSVSLPADEVEARIAGLGDDVVIAAINGPTDVIVSGALDALRTLLAACEAEEIRAKILPVDYASHGPQIDAVGEQLLDELGEVVPAEAAIPLYSTTADEPLDAGHWLRNLRQTVRFAPAVEALLRDGYRTFLEVGPHPVLSVPIESTAEHVLGEPGQAAALATLRRDQGGPARFTAAMAELWVRGGTVDWASAVPEGARVRLPTYAFQRRSYWLDVEPAAPGAAVLVADAPDEPEPDDSFAARVRTLTASERDQAALDAVVGQVAVVLGHASAADVDARLSFKELGFDSPGIVELRNRVNALTGLRIPATALFDHPTPAALAERVVAELTGTAGAGAATGPSRVAADEPIAIIGMACRYPGGVRSPEELWELVASGGDAIGPFPDDRGWDLDRLVDPDGERLGTTYVDRGGFLYDAARFDPELFGISPREALAMDPQQRLLLECSWEALETAGIDPLGLRGSRTGVFTGVMSQDYGPQLHLPDEKSAGYALTGTESSVASGRVSYVLGLEGPAVSVDTACSSSLVALHLACQALRAGECDLALAGGAAVMAQPGIFVEFSRQRGLSPDGRCRAFGDDANGTGWSEGAGVLALAPLSVALAQGHEVLAVIRGSAVNQDGASNGLTAPSGRSQERVIAAALANAGLAPDEVDAVEAHGTGTTLGDPIEATALLSAYGQDRETPLRLGSLKSNIGHAQAAAGVGGVIKMVQALRHETLPPTLWADAPSSHVDWDSGAVELLTEPAPWPAGERTRRAGVSSFGVSGTNAHVLLEQAPALETARSTAPAGPLPFAVSGANADALTAQADRVASHLAEHPDLDADAVAASLALGRAQLGHRAVAVADDLASATAALAGLARGEFSDDVIAGVARPGRRPAFVFPGQGGQWEGMAVELLDASPVFAEHLRACQAALAPHVDWVLEDVLRGAPDAPTLERVDVVQPALWAVMVSLARLWEAHGVAPAAVVGHSQGEIAAAHIAGALSLDDAALVVAGRSRVLTGTLSGQGGMVAVGASAERAAELVAPYDGRVSLAAVNSPTSVVVSGELDGLHDLIARCEADDVRAKLLPVDYAAHSAQIESVRDELLAQFASVTPRASAVPIYSTVTGKRLDGAAMDADYWYENLRQTVLYDTAVRALADEGFDTVVELGPHPVLTSQTLETFEQAGRDPETIAAIGSLRRDEGGPRRFLLSLAEAHVAGLPVDWRPLLGDAPRAPLPTYAFQHERYWLAPRAAGGGDPSAIGQAATGHPLLDAAIPLPDGGTLYTGRLGLDRHPWLADHAVAGTVLLPATGFLDLALHAAGQTDTPRIEELALQAPLVLGEGAAVALQVTVGAPGADGRRELAVHSRAGDAGAWTQHATATLGAAAGVSAALPSAPAGAEDLAGEDLYDRLADAGYEYGPVFQGLRAVTRAGGVVHAEAALPEAVATDGFAMHPALLDAVLQAAVARDLGDGMPVPFSFTGVELRTPGATAVRAALTAEGGETRIVVADDAGAPVLTIDAFGMRPLDRRQLRGGAETTDGLYAVRWEELAAAADRAVPRLAVLGDEDPLGGLVPERHADLAALEAAIADGAPAPDVVLAPVAAADLHELVAGELELLQACLASEALAAARLVVVTRGAVALDHREAPDVAQAALVGLLRSAHTENPDRFTLLDLDASDAPRAALLDGLAAEEPVLAGRGGVVRVPRLTTADAAAPRVDDRAWHLRITTPGTLESLEFAPRADFGRPLDPGEVRVAVHAAGINFADVARALGLVDETTLGLEGSGVVLDVGEDVTDLAPGDRVLGLIPNAFGPEAITDRRLVVPTPEGWTHAQAASVPAVFLTAYYALVDLADLQTGETLVIHSATGGVGTAALQLGRHLGAEIYATSHPDKWETLAALGVDETHRASSRTSEFRETFLSATDGRGADVVLDSLAGELVDASLDLLPRGGRFVEMGKTDIRDPDEVAAAHPGVRYQAFDLLTDPTPERIGEMLAEIVELFDRGVLHHAPISTRDVRDAPDALRTLREARHTGKLVLRVPQPLDPDGTILITGGTGGLGAMLARRLAERDGARHLLLASRRGPAAEGAAELVDALAQLGCEATVVACDVGERDEVEQLLAQVPAERPLTAVFHTAGVLDDATIAGLTAAQLERVLRPKADAALHLDALTRDLDLAEFVLYSSVAATLGLPGQGNYAAANAVLDALADRRRAEGLPAQSLAFGVWETATGMTGHVTGEDAERRAPAGLVPIPDDDGLDLIDTARALGAPVLLPTLLDRPGLRAQARDGLLPPVLSGLFRGAARVTAAADSFAGRLAAAPESDRDALALDLVREHLAAVLGHGSPSQIDAQRTFKELGIDSLSGVELRNRISRATGLTLPATLVFDYPTPTAVGGLLRELAEGRERDTPGPRATQRTTTDEPLAIVGMACRYPGGVGSAEDLWELVVEGRDAIGEFPADRGWDVERIFDADPEQFDTTYTRHGGFLDGGAFDPDHFGINPREALAMDPQQRLLLECAWEALEHAGIDPLGLRGSRTGVFAGAFDSGYGEGNHAQEVQGLRTTGGITSAVSGRISYQLGLVGPAVSVDTACSSSLVAMHLASQALRNDECDLVLAGGVTLLATSEPFVEMSRQRVLSPDGRCRAFGAGGNGTGLADGVGVIVMERLSVARERGHRVLAVVRGSAVNQDGASNGFAAPSGPSQERVIRAALANAGLEPGDVDAVEAHGTGTSLGDPIEAQALIATYGRERPDGPLRLGSLKSNIGHSQAAAGVGGVIKMVQALQHETLPRTLWADEPSPHIPWEGGGVELLTEPAPWPAGGRPRRAAVSSFGISGTNAHLIVEEAPPEAAAAPAMPEIPSRVLPFLVSGSTAAGLAGQAERLGSYVAANPALDPSAVAASLALERPHLSHRAVAVVGGLDELADRLSALARGEFVEAIAQGVVRGERRPAFVFPGQGGQWEGMAVELLDASPVFAEHMRACGQALAPHVDFSLEAVLRGEPGQPSIDLIEVVQPVLFSIMVSLAGLWRSFGVEPAAVVGHSQGEIAAAHVIGGLTLEDAAKIVAVRSQALATIAGVGGMLSVSLSLEQLAERTPHLGERITVAAVNGPHSLVISGDPEIIDEFATACEDDNVRVRRILSTVPGHSPHVEAVRDLMLDGLADVAPLPSTIPLYSTVTGERLATETMDAEHWYRNLRQTVLFEPAARKLIGDGAGALVEIGPHPVLAAPLQEILDSEDGAADVPALTSLRRDDGGLERFIRSLGEAHAAGVQVDWTALFGDTPPHTPLPTYAFQHQHYWLEPKAGAQDAGALGLSAGEHPILKAKVPLPGGGAVWTGRLSLGEQPWLADHAVLGQVVAPATLFLDLALHAAIDTDTPVIADLDVRAPLVLEPGRAVAVQVTVTGTSLTVSSHPEGDQGGLVEHAVGTLAPPDDAPVSAVGDWPADGEELVRTTVYAQLSETGFDLGPVFQGMERAARDGYDVIVEAALADEAEDAHDYDLHPALLAAGLHATPGLPIGFSGVRLHQRGVAALTLRVTPDGRVAAEDPGGAPVISIDAVRTQPIEHVQPARRSLRNGLYAIDWTAAPHTGGTADFAVVDALENAGDTPPAHLVLPVTAPATDDLAADAHTLTETVMTLLQEFLATEALATTRLVMATRGAVATAPGEHPDLRHSPLAGLLRAANSEHPDRFALLDLDDTELTDDLLAAALATGESEIAVRDGALLVPRVHAYRDADPDAAPPADPAGTMLVTGGPTGLGAMLARHLAEAQGAKHLLLVSRRGPTAPGASELVAELADAGCTAEVVACDVTDRDALAQLLASIPADRPLTAVFHSAAALDDGVLTGMTPERLHRVMRPKLDAALLLHELTRDLGVAEFVLFSSAASCLGSPGQSNYAAANAFLDALAATRRADGLPGIALAFGFWDRVTELTAHLTTDDGRRVGPIDMLPMSDAFGLQLIDAARATGEALLAPMRMDLPALAARAEAGILPPILGDLVRVRPRRAARVAGGYAAANGNGASGPRGADAEAIRGEIAASLGYATPASVDMELTFLELGFDSLVSLELRKRLQALTGLTLPATVMFDHPTPSTLIAHIQGELGVTPEPAAAAANGNGHVNGNGNGAGLGAMFRRAHLLGKLKDGVAVAHAASALRPRFGVSHIKEQAPSVIPLTQGDAEPVLYCIPSLIASSGPHEYARFAKEFQGRREVVAVPVPGFAPGELLPSRLDAVAGAQATAIALHADGRPFALVGFSTGGLLAYAVAAELAKHGVAPTSLTLVDSYTMETMWSIADAVFERMIAGDGEHPAIDEERLTAMGAYLGLLTDWTPQPPAVPTLLVKATTPVPGVIRVGDWTATWPQRTTTADVPGTHLTMLEDDAPTTARAVEDWVAAHPAAAPPVARRRPRFRIPR